MIPNHQAGDIKGSTYADMFADCVVGRASLDSIIRVRVVLALVFLVPALSVVVALWTSRADPGLTGEGPMIFALAMASVLFCFICCFLLHSMVRRNLDHARRDVVWRESLAGFLGARGFEHDCNPCDDLGELECRFGLSRAIFAVSAVYLVMFGCLMYAGADMYSLPVIVSWLMAYVLLLIHFIVTVSTVLDFPYRHDSEQCEFSSALCSAEPFKRVRPMGGNCRDLRGRRWWWVPLVVTFGLYSIYLILAACREMNRHIRGQWDYEEELLRAIVEAEGATGIVGNSGTGVMGGLIRR